MIWALVVALASPAQAAQAPDVFVDAPTLSGPWEPGLGGPRLEAPRGPRLSDALAVTGGGFGLLGGAMMPLGIWVLDGSFDNETPVQALLGGGTFVVGALVWAGGSAVGGVSATVGVVQRVRQGADAHRSVPLILGLGGTLLGLGLLGVAPVLGVFVLAVAPSGYLVQGVVNHRARVDVAVRPSQDGFALVLRF